MTEDSGGNADRKLYQLTADEEAALLAEYGTEGPFDEGLEWTAPSQFKSGLGGGDVFLTGPAADEDDDDAERGVVQGGGNASGTAPVGASVRAIGTPAYADPLTLYLLRHAPTLVLPTRTTPASLAAPISEFLSSNEKAVSDDKDVRAHTAAAAADIPYDEPSSFSPVLRCGREWERRASLAVQGVPTSAIASYLLSGEDNYSPSSFCSPAEVSEKGAVGEVRSSAGKSTGVADVEYEKLIGTTARLLREADNVFTSLTAAPSDVDPADAEVQQEVEELQRREALLSEDVVDQFWEKADVLDGDDEDASTRALLQRAREGRQRLRRALASCEKEDEPMSNFESGARPSSASPPDGTAKLETEENVLDETQEAALPEYLFAFEMELPHATGITLNIAADEEAPSASALENAAPATVTPSAVLSAYEEVQPLLSQRARATSTEVPVAVTETPPALHAEEVSIPQLLLRSTEVLRSMASAEARDVHILYKQGDSGRRALLPPSSQSQVRKPLPSRDALGLVALPSFVERLDTLLSPTHEECQERERRAKIAGAASKQGSQRQGGASDEASGNRLDTSAPSAPAGPAASKGGDAGGAGEVAATSLERIRQRAAVESFLLAREMEEGRRMRREDELVEREVRAAMELAALFQERMTVLHTDEEATRSALLVEAAAAFQEITVAQVKDAALARQVEQLRHLQAVEALAYTLKMEWEVHRERLVEEEALTFRRLVRDAVEAAAQAAAATEKRKAVAAAAANAYLDELKKSFEAHRAAVHENFNNSCAGNKHDIAASQSRWFQWRIEPLLQEREHLMQWATAQRKNVEALRAMLGDAGDRYRQHIAAAAHVSAAAAQKSQDATKNVLQVPASPPTQATGADHAGAVLTAGLLLHLLWPAFRAATVEPAAAAQFLALWPLSLEDLEAVDWPSLQSLILVSEGENETAQLSTPVPATALVKALDMSSNSAMRSFDVWSATRTFPALLRLNVSHSQLATLDAGDDGGAGGSSPVSSRAGTGATARGRLSSSTSAREESRPASSAHLRHISAARNNAVAEQVHLLDVDVSSNKLRSLRPLGVMATASLTRCSAADNQIASLDSIASCVQLRGIAVARNALTSLMCLDSLPFLREVDAGSNAVTQFDGSDDDGSRASTTTTRPSVSLLSKLYLSHNGLRTLATTSTRVYVCLSHLFVNHNALTALDVETMAWFPLLSVLQAEGNKLTSITGLRHCTRLESVKLSSNQLADVDALLPLASCRRLQSLDLSNNPVLSSGDENRTDDVVEFVRAALPFLEEFNNAPFQRLASAGLNAGASRSVAMSAPTTTEAYAEMFPALCWDGVLRHVQEERELREALLLREVNRAKGWEATLTAEHEPASTPNNFPSSAHQRSRVDRLYGITAAQRDVRQAEHARELALYELDALTLSTWVNIGEQEKAGLNSTRLYANHHVSHGAYWQQEEDAFRKVARAFIAEWLLSRVHIRRARRLLCELRRAFRQSEAFKREAAARRIQPLWRGAALRSRLKRLLRGSNALGGDDDVDMNAFTKVDVDDWLTEDASALAPVERLLRTVVDSARDVVAVPFDVPATAKLPAVAADGSSVTFTPVPPAGEGSRRPASSALSGRPTLHLSAPRTESAARAKKTTDTAAGEEEVTPTSLEDQWGPAVAAQIRKKQHKNTRANNERLRKEFIQDPLRVQHEMRGAQANRKPK